MASAYSGKVPLLVIALGLLLFFALVLLLLPISLVQRYRVGTARRPARGWVTALNLWAVALSSAIFLAGAAITNIWVPGAFRYAALGYAAGGALGLLGLVTSRWERHSGLLHYTPNRWLVLGITLTVTGRILYGFWRSWDAWQAGLSGGSWFVAAGIPGSLAAGALVLGYYFVYWAGVRRRLARHRRMFGWPGAARPYR